MKPTIGRVCLRHMLNPRASRGCAGTSGGAVEVSVDQQCHVHFVAPLATTFVVHSMLGHSAQTPGKHRWKKRLVRGVANVFTATRSGAIGLATRLVHVGTPLQMRAWPLVIHVES